MKVLYLSSYFTSYVHDQINELIKNRNIEATVDFSQDAYCYLRSRKIREKYKHYDYSDKIPDKLWDFTLYPGFPKNMFESFNAEILFKRLFNKYKYLEIDLIHSHTIFPSGYVAMRLADKLNVPFVVSSHGVDFYRCLENVSETRDSKPYSKETIKKVKKTLRKASYVIAVSDKFGKDIKLFAPDARVKVIENGYKKHIFYPREKTEIRKKLYFKPDVKYLISVGNLVKTKGHIHLIKALPEIIKFEPDIKLILVGNGNEKIRLMNKLRELKLTEYVEFHDFLQPEKLAEYYSASDLFIFPSLNEAFGIALVEAMACGLPAIATKTHGPTGIIDVNETGFITEINSSQQIADKVIKLLADKKLILKMSKKAALVMPVKYGEKYSEIYEIYKESLK
ncbi:MAG: hypothetical protein CSB55_03930 [Candidatus Cloacimonadota bacterium]|nr:MAG: hypothetical protein CSB55_03930 [Candidatus Cloacimonadota bacterium]